MMGGGRQRGPLTIVMTTAEPASTRCRRLLLGKEGSPSPATGFTAVVGAEAADWGLGRSWRGAGA